jgi:hypothetical protein
MPSPHPQSRELVARSLTEAIETVATPTVRDSVIGRALRDAGRSSIPEAGPEVLEFADGPLRHALSDRLGDDVASEVLDQIRPVLERASMRPSMRPAAPAVAAAVPLGSAKIGSVRPTRPAPADPALLRASTPVDESTPEEESGVFAARRLPALTDPAPSAEMPIVFLASRDPGAAAALARSLGGRATVRVVEGLLDLLEAVDEEARVRRVLVLDAAQPSIHVRSLVTVAPELAGRAKVLVWRAFDEDRDALESAPVSADEWERCSSHALVDLAEACFRAIR